MGLSSVRREVWMARAADWWAGAWRWMLLAIGLALGVYLLLDRGVADGVLTAAAVGVLVIGAAMTGRVPMAIPLLAMPALFIVQRVGLGDTDLSVSDVALAAAFGTALLLGQRPYSPTLRTLLWLNLAYQFATLFTVIVNPYTANTVEWFHAWLLVSGALVVGWALGRAGYAHLALSLMLASGAVIAIGTMLTGVFVYAQGDFGPVYPTWPFPMHKNAAGTFLVFVALIAYVHPQWARLSRGWTRAVFWLSVVAIVMTQSRQAIISLVAVLIVLGLRRGATRGSRALVLLAIPGIWLVVSTILEQIDSQNQHNSYFQRLDWIREVYAFWKHAPIFGHGLRYWYTDVTANFQPPQAELEVVASAGIVGLVAFLAMIVGMLVVLWRIEPAFGTLAFAVVLSRIVQSQFDLFWVAGAVSVPFVIAGVCVGAMARHASDDDALSQPWSDDRSRRQSRRLA